MMRRRTAVWVAAASVMLGLPVAPALVADTPEPIVCELPADQYVEQDLDGGAVGASLGNATEVLRFANLSDSHIIDDESNVVMTQNQLEVALDPTIGNNSAQRLQEEFTDETLNAMVTTLNACDAADELAFMIATGDLTDNATLNEVRRYIDNLGGTHDQLTAFEQYCGYVTHNSNGTAKLGAPAACPLTPAVLAVPTGRAVGDAQSPPPDDDLSQDPTWALRPLASAQQVANATEASLANGSHTVAPGLPPALDCDAGVAGCTNVKLAMDHYAVFGNHDGYPRGTVTFQQPFQAGSLPFGRYFLESQREFINEYFETAGTPAGHGFHLAGARLADSDDRNDGYYAFDAGTSNRVRIIVLNTIADGVVEEVHGDGQITDATGGHLTGNEVTNTIGLEMGVMDAEQFAWLEGELAAADTADQAVLVFSHHPDNSFSETRLGFPANGPTGKTAVELNQALGRHGNVVAWVAGHTHRNRVRACTPADCDVAGDQSNPANGFWRVETASLVDYPQEGRIAELHELADGGYALKLTMVRPDPNNTTANRARRLSIWEEDCSTAAVLGGPMSSGPYDPGRLAEVVANAGEVAGGDYCQGDVVNDLDGPQGRTLDRNVVLFP